MNGSTTAARAQLVHLDRARWESAVEQFRDYSYRQTWAYGVKLAARRGALSEHVAIEHGDAVIGLADVRIKKLPLIGGGLAYISGGPLVLGGGDDDDRLEHLELAIDALVRHYVHGQGLTLRLVAPVGAPEHNESVADRLERAGLRRTERGGRYRTVLLDVERQLDEIRKTLHRNWRHSIKRADRNGVAVSFGTEPERFQQFARMSDALRARKGFELDLDDRFFADVQEDLPDRDRLVVGLAFLDGTPVAGNVTAIHGDTAVYLLGASTEAGLQAQASYLLHWRTIELLRERGVSWYDLGGIDPVGNPGVSSFKTRTNGFDVTAAGPFERSPDGVRGRVADWGERAYLRAARAGGR